MTLKRPLPNRPYIQSPTHSLYLWRSRSQVSCLNTLLLSHTCTVNLSYPYFLGLSLLGVTFPTSWRSRSHLIFVFCPSPRTPFVLGLSCDLFSFELYFELRTFSWFLSSLWRTFLWSPSTVDSTTDSSVGQRDGEKTGLHFIFQTPIRPFLANV